MDERRLIQDRLNFYHWCCKNHPEIVREWKGKEWLEARAGIATELDPERVLEKMKELEKEQ